MRMLVSVLLILMTAMAFGADRKVLIEDFVNCGCSYCWDFEPILNAFVNSHLAAEDVAVIRVHVNWPYSNDPIYVANPGEQSSRRYAYGVNAVPWVQVDGTIHASNSSGGLAAAFNSRINVPTSLSIIVARNGDDQTGTVSIGLIAEDSISTETITRLSAIIVENQIPGVVYWASSYFEQAFRDNLFGTVGHMIQFEPPFPDTIYFEADYDISGWVSDNLYIATFVQRYAGGNKEVLNARWDKFMDLETGLETELVFPQYPQLSVGPNPSSGTVRVTPELPEGSMGTISVFDLSGRQVASEQAFNDWEVVFDLQASGVYLIRLVTGSGQCVTRSVAVIR